MVDSTSSVADIGGGDPEAMTGRKARTSAVSRGTGDMMGLLVLDPTSRSKQLIPSKLFLGSAAFAIGVPLRETRSPASSSINYYELQPLGRYSDEL